MQRQLKFSIALAHDASPHVGQRPGPPCLAKGRGQSSSDSFIASIQDKPAAHGLAAGVASSDHTRTPTLARAHTRTRTHARAHARTRTHTCTRTRAHTHAHTRTHTHAHTHAHARTHTHTHTHAHAHAQPHNRTRTHTRTHTRAHTTPPPRPHTHAHGKMIGTWGQSRGKRTSGVLNTFFASKRHTRI